AKASITGLARSNTACSPPTITVSTPFSAPACPPETGASRKSNPPADAAAASSRATSAEAVVLSMKIAPFFIAAKAPSSPIVTWRRSSSLPTQAKTKSLSLAASAGVLARVPPCSAIHFSAFATVRLYTVTSWPPLCLRCAAMGYPITPRPRNATFAITYLTDVRLSGQVYALHRIRQGRIVGSAVEMARDPPFDPFDGVAKRFHDQQVNDRRPQVGLEIEGAGVGEAGDAHQVIDGDESDDCRALDHQDHFVAIGTKRDNCGLRQDDLAQGRELVQAERGGAFPLAFWNALNGSAQDLRLVGGGIQREGEQGTVPRIPEKHPQPDRLELRPHRPQAEIARKSLRQQRRAAEQVDIAISERGDETVARHAPIGNRNGKYRAAYE